MNVRSAWIVLMLAVVWLATPSTASAQVGVLVGFNSANLTFDTEEIGINISGDRRSGFVGGVTFNAPIRDAFSVELDALVAQKGTQFTFSGFGETDTGKARITYVDIPVMGRINLPGSGPARVHLLAGPSFNFKVSEKLEPEEDQEDQFETFETAFVFGGGVTVNRFRVDVRYGLGLMNIIKDEDELTGKNRVFSVLVGVELR